MADPFDDILNIESQFIEQGQAEGRTDGRRSGLEEGRLVGLGRGFGIAKEIGFYYGCTVVWLGLPSNLEDAPERYVCSLEDSVAFPLFTCFQDRQASS
jgi:hypothetical protein